jgi:2-oxoglutarate dehydrogenase E2 component (dihydrolipoamide succinyltransferase)
MPVEIRVPALGESVVEATIAQWLKNPGDSVEAGEPVVELETDKVNVEVPAEVSGVLGALTKQAGDTVGVGEVLGTVNEAGDGASAAPQAAPQGETAPASPAPQGNGRDPHSTPLAGRIAAENNIDLSTVTGTRPGGRIGAEDVKSQMEQAAQGPATLREKIEEKATAPVTPLPSTPVTPRPPAPSSAPVAPVSASGRPEERVRMSRRRQVIARNLVQAQQTAAMLTTFNEIDMSAVMEVRKRRKDSFKERFGVNLGFMSFFTKASVGALKQFPYVNAEIQGEEVVLKKYYDVGIAVGAEEGLVVPVIRDADKLSFAGIEKSVAELAGKARDNKLSLSELTGGTFTITNGGVYGSLMSTPILNAPQVGILGLHAIKERPVVVNGEIAIRPMMYVALSYDHRIIDGSTAVRFLVKIKELIEDPETLLLEG